MKLNLKKKEKVKIKDEKIKLNKKKPQAKTEGLGWDILDLIFDIIGEILESIFD